jgi:riboflavin synthase
MKGSVALDGVSLTITGLTDDSVSVNIIPHTWRETSLGERKKGDLVNLEADVIGKYVARFMSVKTGGLTEETLRKAGFCVS